MMLLDCRFGLAFPPEGGLRNLRTSVSQEESEFLVHLANLTHALVQKQTRAGYGMQPTVVRSYSTWKNVVQHSLACAIPQLCPQYMSHILEFLNLDLSLPSYLELSAQNVFFAFDLLCREYSLNCSSREMVCVTPHPLDSYQPFVSHVRRLVDLQDLHQHKTIHHLFRILQEDYKTLQEVYLVQHHDENLLFDPMWFSLVATLASPCCQVTFLEKKVSWTLPIIAWDPSPPLSTPLLSSAFSSHPQQQQFSTTMSISETLDRYIKEHLKGHLKEEHALAEHPLEHFLEHPLEHPLTSAQQLMMVSCHCKRTILVPCRVEMEQSPKCLWFSVSVSDDNKEMMKKSKTSKVFPVAETFTFTTTDTRYRLLSMGVSMNNLHGLIFRKEERWFFSFSLGLLLIKGHQMKKILSTRPYIDIPSHLLLVHDSGKKQDYQQSASPELKESHGQRAVTLSTNFLCYEKDNRPVVEVPSTMSRWQKHTKRLTPDRSESIRKVER